MPYKVKYGVWCVRSAASRFGPDQAWLKAERSVRWEGTREEAEIRAGELKAQNRSPNLNYFAKEITDDR